MMNTALILNDLDMNKELDRAALAQVGRGLQHLLHRRGPSGPRFFFGASMKTSPAGAGLVSRISARRESIGQ